MADKDRGHVWKTDEDGDVDTFAMSYEFHNGPVCVRCGYSYCHHCDHGPKEDCDFIDQLEMPV